MNPPNLSKPRILLVDDHPAIRKGLALLINQQKHFEVCGEASSVEEARRTASALKPDLMIVDLTLGKADGLELIRHLRHDEPNIPVLVLSMHDEQIYAPQALRAGARGYVMKQDAVYQIFTAIEEVLAGQVYLSEKMKRLSESADHHPDRN
ncbi:MAG: response regulator transcription factor [Verrucomicrobia bacterium]|nr:response regulator transcription factor [Verrucomicrobiota bacterium]